MLMDTWTSVEMQRHSQSGNNAVNNVDCFICTGGILQQHGELIASHAGHGISLANGGADALTNGDEHLVPDIVPKAVVDELEAVQIDQDHGYAVIMSPD